MAIKIHYYLKHTQYNIIVRGKRIHSTKKNTYLDKSIIYSNKRNFTYKYCGNVYLECNKWPLIQFCNSYD